MPKHKHQNSQNRLNTVTSVGPEASYQAKGQEMYTSSNNEGIFISADDIQKRAYEIYEQKGGSEMDNWLEAEKALREEQYRIS